LPKCDDSNFSIERENELREINIHICQLLTILLTESGNPATITLVDPSVDILGPKEGSLSILHVHVLNQPAHITDKFRAKFLNAPLDYNNTIYAYPLGREAALHFDINIRPVTDPAETTLPTNNPIDNTDPADPYSVYAASRNDSERIKDNYRRCLYLTDKLRGCRVSTSTLVTLASEPILVKSSAKLAAGYDLANNPNAVAYLVRIQDQSEIVTQGFALSIGSTSMYNNIVYQNESGNCYIKHSGGGPGLTAQMIENVKACNLINTGLADQKINAVVTYVDPKWHKNDHLNQPIYVYVENQSEDLTSFCQQQDPDLEPPYNNTIFLRVNEGIIVKYFIMPLTTAPVNLPDTNEIICTFLTDILSRSGTVACITKVEPNFDLSKCISGNSDIWAYIHVQNQPDYLTDRFRIAHPSASHDYNNMILLFVLDNQACLRFTNNANAADQDQALIDESKENCLRCLDLTTKLRATCGSNTTITLATKPIEIPLGSPFRGSNDTSKLTACLVYIDNQLETVSQTFAVKFGSSSSYNNLVLIDESGQCVIRYSGAASETDTSMKENARVCSLVNRSLYCQDAIISYIDPRMYKDIMVCAFSSDVYAIRSIGDDTGVLCYIENQPDDVTERFKEYHTDHASGSTYNNTLSLYRAGMSQSYTFQAYICISNVEWPPVKKPMKLNDLVTE
jgi:hypothetical protein